MAGEKQQGGHRYTLSMKSVITPLHTFPTIFISWVCVTWCTVLYPSVSSPALHPWWRGRVLCELTKHESPLRELRHIVLSHFSLDEMPAILKVKLRLSLQLLPRPRRDSPAQTLIDIIHRSILYFPIQSGRRTNRAPGIIWSKLLISVF